MVLSLSSSESIRNSKIKENDQNIADRSPSAPELCGLVKMSLESKHIYLMNIKRHAFGVRIY